MIMEGRPKIRNLQNKCQSFRMIYRLKFLRNLSRNYIIFLTGKSLDDYLKKYALKDTECKWISIDEHKVLHPDNICEIKISDKDHPLYQTKIIRAYHPTYFMGRINGHKRLKSKLESKNIKGKLSDYYYKVLINRIKSISFF